jgi:hypothetical protein
MSNRRAATARLAEQARRSVTVVDHLPAELESLRNWRALPENERVDFNRAIDERAALHRDESIDFVPTIVVHTVRLADTDLAPDF